MNDPAVVGVFDGLGNLFGDAKGVGDRQRTRERLAFDQLHHDRLTSAAVLEPIDRRDVGMIEGGKQLGFALESRHALRIGGEGDRQHLQRNVAL